ncbi:MAG: MerR family transcriptional regulator [Deltaproteobacteria bacterium]|jgi:hypothetical protein|nr:MerR family transcriptional regulator [Deltaproteobacteria bacterium]
MKGPLLSIGALAKATGIPVDTLRTWERRYGFPEVRRLPSGHRRFTDEAVERLQLVRAAMALGYRASEAVPAGIEELRRRVSRVSEPSPGDHDGDLMDFVAAMDGSRLEHRLRQEWNRRGALAFVKEVCGPLLVGMGEAWARGDIGIRHEHYAAQILAGFLGSQWRAMSTGSPGPIVVCATLDGEPHVLGLHMAAVILALSGAQIRFLGADLPAADIAEAAKACGARALALSASSNCDRQRLVLGLKDLRQRLSPTCPIWIGGAGADGLEEPTARALSLEELHVAATHLPRAT